MGIALSDCEKKGFDDGVCRMELLLPFLYIIWSTPTNLIILWKPRDEFFLKFHNLNVIENL